MASRFSAKLHKAWRALRTRGYRQAIFKGVAAAVEHEDLLRSFSFNTVVDVGANRGQFSLVARRCFPRAQLFSFEPLAKPAATFAEIFADDPLTKLFVSAIGPINERRAMHLSARDDSSSLLEIGPAQRAAFPGTQEIGLTEIDVAPLEAFVSRADIRAPALLKVDVQGFEYEVLVACRSLLPCFDVIYCECSFIELYMGQKLAPAIESLLAAEGYSMAGMHNPAYNSEGRRIQADLLFSRSPHGPGLSFTVEHRKLQGSER